jgi:hypothetical protein
MQRIITNQHMALMNNVVAKQMMLHVRERPELRPETFDDKSIIKSEFIGDNSMEGDSTRVYIAKYN